MNASAVPAPARVTLGDLQVNRLGFGTMRLVDHTGSWPRDVDAAIAVLRGAAEAGVTFFDTADIYGLGVAEELLAKALAPYDGLVIATKGGFVGDFSKGIPLPADGRPEALRTACEGSLRRLDVERIDLYQLHTPDPTVPIEESIGALAELQREGKIRHIGVSNVGCRHLKAIEGIADVVSVQNRYGVGDRTAAGVLSWCTERGIAFIPWSPLNSSVAVRDVVTRVAADAEITAQQAALAWLLAQSPCMLPIPGTSSLQHLNENLGASGIQLTDEQIARLDAARTAAM
ncbi:aldo/keto reductase [Nocardia sp. NPDC005366]|uniref:aldo/keto reductase n=1 Tax=Nocardia sp. NPDC005366 TaxID=3156878 RepID=UPI0033AA8776